jgi:hypothetical protein
MVENLNLYGILAGNTEVKEQLCRPKRRWEDSIYVDFRTIYVIGQYELDKSCSK